MTLVRVAFVSALLTLSWLAEPAATPDISSQPIPALSNDEFRRLIVDLSEAGGAFQTDNFVSNETSISDAVRDLEERDRRGGVYLGVGPEQNFSYIVALKPQVAFIVDIRRANMLHHLLYKALAELSADRDEFLSRLFSRPRPPEAAYGAELPVMMQAVRRARPTQERFTRNFADVIECLTVRHALTLTAGDQRTIRSIFDQFRSIGPDIGYVGRSSQWPTFAEIATATDRAGVSRTFLATEERFRVFKSYQERNLIVPIVGDFAGKKALRAVAEYLRERGLAVSTFYVSNVEQYLFRGGEWRSFYGNVQALPLDRTSLFVRSFPNLPDPALIVRGQNYRTNSPVPTSTIAIGPIAPILTAVREGKIASFADLAAHAGVPVVRR